MSKLYFKCNFRSAVKCCAEHRPRCISCLLMPIHFVLLSECTIQHGFYVLGVFFPSKAKWFFKKPLQHLRGVFSCGPAGFKGSCTVWPKAVRASQFAGCFDFLSSIENIEAGFAQLASLIFGRAGVALDAPGTQISWPFAWSLCDAFEIMLEVSDISVGILWCRQAWNRITNLCWCETAKWCSVTLGTTETPENSDPL